MAAIVSADPMGRQRVRRLVVPRSAPGQSSDAGRDDTIDLTDAHLAQPRGGEELTHEPEETTSFTSPRPSPPSPAALDQALKDLSEVLAVHPFRSLMPACAHCVTYDDLRLLGRDPATIPPEVLERFVNKAMITWGEETDFKRLTPEILRRAFDGILGVPEALVGARLRRADWSRWPAAEAPAVRRTLLAGWADLIDAMPAAGRTPVSTRLGLILTADDELGPYLNLWEDRLEAPADPRARLYAVLHLSQLLAPLASGGRRRLERTFPLARRAAVSQLDQWLRLPVAVRRLAHAADALSGTPQGLLVAQAREGLAHLKTDR